MNRGPPYLPLVGLLDLVAAERSRTPPPIAIDEFGIGESGVWVEAANHAAEAVSLARCALTVGPVLRETIHRFGFLHPTPGEPNPAEVLTPPPTIDDGGVDWLRERRGRVRVRIPGWAGPVPELTVILHYRAGGDWREASVDVRAASMPSLSGTIGVAEADIELEGPDSTGDVEYWFQVRSRDGIERRAPPDAPREIYSRWPRGDD